MIVKTNAKIGEGIHPVGVYSEGTPLRISLVSDNSHGAFDL